MNFIKIFKLFLILDLIEICTKLLLQSMISFIVFIYILLIYWLPWVDQLNAFISCSLFYIKPTYSKSSRYNYFFHSILNYIVIMEDIYLQNLNLKEVEGQLNLWHCFLIHHIMIPQEKLFIFINFGIGYIYFLNFIWKPLKV